MFLKAIQNTLHTIQVLEHNKNASSIIPFQLRIKETNVSLGAINNVLHSRYCAFNINNRTLLPEAAHISHSIGFDCNIHCVSKLLLISHENGIHAAVRCVQSRNNIIHRLYVKLDLTACFILWFLRALHIYCPPA